MTQTKTQTNLEDKIKQKTACLAVVGLGYVGLPLAIEFAKVGFSVVGIEENKNKVERVNNGENYIIKEEQQILKELVDNKKIKAVNGFAALSDVDVIFICVPTPLTKHREPDISYVESVTREAAKYLKKGHLIILESTTYPGTTEEVMLPILTESGFKLGEDFYLAFSPERVDPGNKTYTTKNTAKIIGGMTQKCRDLTQLLYSQVMDEVYVASSPKAAEMVKLLENIFRCVNIALVNELALLCKKMNINIWEVIDLASTKPYGFMPFYPGPGLGGHCLVKDEYIYLKDKNGVRTTTIGEEFEKTNNSSTALKHDFLGTKFIKPKDINALSFNLNTQENCYKEVKMLTKRYYPGEILTFITKDGRKISVTDKHPLIIYDKNLEVKFASDTRIGDKLIISTDIPQECKEYKVDIIEYLVNNKVDLRRIRVRFKNLNLKSFQKEITPVIKKHSKYYHDYYKKNYLPLKAFLEIENKLNVSREEIILCAGKGPSYSEVFSVINIDENFCRLLGYYLSEGCVTKDKSYRVRFTFNVKEKELIEDLIKIITKLGLRCSIYNSKKWASSCIKVSSNLFGILIKDILKCGVNSYTMQIPSMIFSLSRSHKMEILKGLFNGDGSVEFKTGKRTYSKNGKKYCHNNNAALVSYFSCSRRLIQQTALLAQSVGLISTFKSADSIRFYGLENLKILSGMLAGDKKKLIEKYLDNKLRSPKNKSYIKLPNFAVVNIKEIKKSKGGEVYSLEIKDTNTFVTSYGIITHNCIPIDPFYLTWKAREYDFQTKFIELAGEINMQMPYYVVNMTMEALNSQNKTLKNAKILLLGVAYKKDIDDPRESPSLKIIEILETKGAQVKYNDSYIKQIKINGKEYKSADLSDISSYNCVVIATDHSYYDYEKIAKEATLVIDTRNALKEYKNDKIWRL